MHYRGRFAPTPSGPLHAGSLLTATASWLEARRHHGEWWVRVDDIDPPREAPGAADAILRQLEHHGLHWDGPVHYQSRHHARYQAAVERLLERGLAFHCPLSRSDLSRFGGIHPGPSVAVPPRPGTAIRLSVPDRPVGFVDALQGPQQADLARLEGPFVIRRRDGLYAYQLACAVDDAEQGMTHVLRGADLLDSTLRQCHVLDALDHPRPRYAHLPVLVDATGHKLSKSRGAAALGPDAAANLWRALARLGLPPPPPLAGAPCQELLAWALPHWQSSRLAHCRTLRSDTGA